MCGLDHPCRSATKQPLKRAICSSTGIADNIIDGLVSSTRCRGIAVNVNVVGGPLIDIICWSILLFGDKENIKQLSARIRPPLTILSLSLSPCLTLTGIANYRFFNNFFISYICIIL